VRRSGPLKAKTPLRRGKPIRRSNRKRTPPQIHAAVLARDGNCKARFVAEGPCGGALHVHHLLPRGRGGSHDMDNLRVVCNVHHRYLHDHPNWAKEHDLLR
jgi:5-methylcytosine-specific restriction endonuclease McrA